MKVIIQRVIRASVSTKIENETIARRIGPGLCILVGIHRDDTEKEMEHIVKKILSIKLFPDEQGRHWKKSVKELGYEILSVSQFTLYANCIKGGKPDFHLAMKTEQAKQFYERFLQRLIDEYNVDRIKDGFFGEFMNVDILNDGPVTIEINS